MSFDDGAADRKPQAYTRDGRFRIATGEGLEDRPLAPCGQAWPAVPDGDLGFGSAHAGAHAQQGAGRGELERVVEQVDQHAFEQHGVGPHQRKVCGKVDLQRMLRQGSGIDGAQRAANQLLDRLPVLPQRDLPGLQAGHVEQIVHHAGQPPRLLQQAERLAVQRGGIAWWMSDQTRGEDFSRAHQGGQRGAQIVRQRRQQGVAHALGLHGQQGILCHADEVDAFERNSDLGGAGFQQAAQLGNGG